MQLPNPHTRLRHYPRFVAIAHGAAHMLMVRDSFDAAHEHATRAIVDVVGLAKAPEGDAVDILIRQVAADCELLYLDLEKAYQMAEEGAEDSDTTNKLAEALARFGDIDLKIAQAHNTRP